MILLPPPTAAELQHALRTCRPSQHAQDGQAPPPIRTLEYALADLSGLARGKQVRLEDGRLPNGCLLPSVLLGMGLTGGSADVFGTLLPSAYPDLQLVPDLRTCRPRPGRPGEATVLCEPQGRWWAPAYDRELEAAELSPRTALRRVLAEYEAQQIQAWVAPEVEMFLLHRDTAHPDEPLSSARARPGAPARESACEAYSLERTTQFEPYFDELYAACEVLGIPVMGHHHEAALSQYEVNFHPGPALAQADAVFRFKRLAREVAARHGFLASFAAKPFLDQPGAGMHWHVSLQHQAPSGGNADPADTWPHVFAHPNGDAAPALHHFIAGLQAHVPPALALLAPYELSFERLRLSDASPTCADWGHDNRHAAFRIPPSPHAAALRVENRLPGGDTHPYLALALTLAAGWAGLRDGKAPTPAATATASATTGQASGPSLPHNLNDALDQLSHAAVARDALGAPLIDLYLALKRQEQAERAVCAQPRSQWDLKHLIELA